VKPGGVRSYIIQYGNRNTSASRRLTIEQHGPLLTFDQAKKQARAMLADAMRGDDPVEVRRTARRALSVANLAADYLERYAVPKKRPKSVRDDRSLLDRTEHLPLSAQASTLIASIIETTDMLISRMILYVPPRNGSARRSLAFRNSLSRLSVAKLY
jgi:hypothetical protein